MEQMSARTPVSYTHLDVYKRQINEIMNQCISGWRYFPNPRMFSEYGRQKGWERENPATDSGNPPEKTMDGFVEVTEPVSYTHLDVYKRQVQERENTFQDMPDKNTGKYPEPWAYS